MSEVHPLRGVAGASRHAEGAAPPRDVGRWLRLAAMPTFAIMALLTTLGGGAMDGLCLSGHGAPLSGMFTMYLLMAAFHAPPWLNLIFGRPDPQYSR